MSYTHHLHPFAHFDIIEAYEWYELNKKGLGEDFINTIHNTIKQITTHPHTFSSKLNPNYREAVVKKFPFVIVYKVNDIKKDVFIASIHHAKKHPRLKYR